MKKASLLLMLLFTGLTAFAQPEAPASDSLHNDTLIIAGVGDIMLGTFIPSRQYLPPNEDCSGELLPTSTYFLTADVAMCNLEGVLTDSPAGRKSCKNPDICYTFGMPVKFVRCLADAGFDLISVANNHCKDFGTPGKLSTAKALDSAGLHYAGWTTHPYTVYENKGVKYGFCAFSPETGNVDMRRYDEAAALVRKLDSICDIIIVSFHSGAEGAACQHVPRADEMFMGYNRGNVYKFAHTVIDAGADVVFGHGPHVTRAIEVYNNRFIAYSLGNYCTYSKISIAGVCGLAPIIRVYTRPDGSFIKAQIISTWQEKFQPPKVDPSARVLKVIQNLTRTDFPETPVVIGDDGWVFPK